MSELHLIIGCMFSGKTSKLLNIAKTLHESGTKVMLINYFEDTRYSTTDTTTHDGVSINLKTHMVKDLNSVVYGDYSVICVNEAQFFPNLLHFCKQALQDNKILYISGLDADFRQEKFGEIIDLIPMSDSVTKLHAKCKTCNNKAYFTKRLTNNQEQKVIGSDSYVPVCRDHI